MSKYARDLPQGQLVTEIDKLIAKDAIRNQSLPYANYPGRSISPMSSYTQKARELRQKAASKQAPYAGRLQSVLNRPVGFAPGAVDKQVEFLRKSGEAFNQNRMLQPLQRQFGASFAPGENKFLEQSSKDAERSLEEARSSLGGLGSSIANLDNKRNEQAAKTLSSMQGQKVTRQNNLINNLNQFGDQMHGYNNLQSAMDKNRFIEQRDEKSLYLSRLAQANDAARNIGFNPDLQKASGEKLIQSLRAYGVDPSKPINEWESSRSSPAVYPGKGVAAIPEEIKYSGSLLERINPSLSDNYAPERKKLTKGLLENAPIGESALSMARESMMPKSVELDSRAKKMLKSDLAYLNNKYIKLGQYGSEQHLGEARARAREIQKSALEQRSKLLLDGIKTEASNNFNQEANNISKLGMLADAGNNEFNNVLSNVRNLNQLGATKWRNEQSIEEDAYRNFQNEKNWAWPNERNNIDAKNEVFKGLPERNIDLDRLNQLNTRYSEQDKDSLSALPPISSLKDFWQNNYGSYQRENQRAAAEARGVTERAEEAAAASEAERIANAEKLARKAEKERKKKELWDIMTPSERDIEEKEALRSVQYDNYYPLLKFLEGARVLRTSAISQEKSDYEKEQADKVSKTPDYRNSRQVDYIRRNLENDSAHQKKLREYDIRRRHEEDKSKNLYKTPIQEAWSKAERAWGDSYDVQIKKEKRKAYKMYLKDMSAQAVKEYQKELLALGDDKVDKKLLAKLLRNK